MKVAIIKLDDGEWRVSEFPDVHSTPSPDVVVLDITEKEYNFWFKARLDFMDAQDEMAHAFKTQKALETLP